MAKKKKVIKEETPVFSGETMAPEIPKEENIDHVPTEVTELPLKDEVVVSKEELPKDEVKTGEVTAEQVLEAAKVQSAQDSVEEWTYVPRTTPKPVKPIIRHTSDPVKQWVADPALLRKVEGYRDTLNGTLYYGILK